MGTLLRLEQCRLTTTYHLIEKIFIHQSSFRFILIIAIKWTNVKAKQLTCFAAIF